MSVSELTTKNRPPPERPFEWPTCRDALSEVTDMLRLSHFPVSKERGAPRDESRKEGWMERRQFSGSAEEL